MWQKWVSVGLVFLGMLLLAGCQPTSQGLVGTDITGADFANQFQLTDHQGQSRTLSDFKGKVTVIFFGYTHCPDVCPTTMADLAKAMKLLENEADQVQVLFITLDPERDTKDVLAKFVPSFNPRFLGLFGDAKQTEDALKNFKIFASRQTESGKSGYVIDHSAGLYIYDTAGHIRVYSKYGEKPAELAQDIRYVIEHPLP